ncbi:MAG: B12-binding domain-containing radical SAM protein [Alphaproteobacteria bacterium]
MSDSVAAAAETALNRLFPRRLVRRVLLVTPPDADAALFRFDTAKRGRYTNYPPYGLLVLAANLRRLGLDVRVVNLNDAVLGACHAAPSPEDFDVDAVWTSRIDAEMADFAPDLIGVTCMFTMTHASFRTVCRHLAGRGAPLMVGGVHVSNDVERILDDVAVADLAVVGEGDRAVPLLLEVINRRRPAGDLGNLVIDDRAAGRRLRFPETLRPTAEEIDVIPAYDLIDLPAHSRHGTIGAFYCFKPAGTRYASVLSNRGCRGQCTFCSVRSFNGEGVRQRSIASVVDELELLRDQHGVGHVMWLDDDLFKDHRRAVALFTEMARRRLGITWDATNGVIAASCTEEVIAAAAASGCIALNIGMESGNPGILRSIRKPGTVDTFLRAAEVLRRHEDIHASLLLMLGFPGETMRMIWDTIRVAREMDLDWCRTSQLQPLPNTPIHDAMVAQGQIQPVGSTDVRFNGGAFGKQAEIEQGLRLATADFEAAFAAIPLDAVPDGAQLTDVWFFMNYHLNFHRIFSEHRPVKIAQLMAHLRVLGDVISPENAFALYFLGFLQQRSEGRIEPAVIARLRRRMETSPYWRDRFRAFGLDAEDLLTLDFRNRDLPRLVPRELA